MMVPHVNKVIEQSLFEGRTRKHDISQIETRSCKVLGNIKVIYYDIIQTNNK